MKPSTMQGLTKAEIASGFAFGLAWAVFCGFVVAFSFRHHLAHRDFRLDLLGPLVIIILTGAGGSLVFKRLIPGYLNARFVSSTQLSIETAVLVLLSVVLAIASWKLF